MKTIAKIVFLALLGYVTKAAISDFPEPAEGQAYCDLQVTYPNRQCSTVWARFNAILPNYAGDDGDYGYYTLVEVFEEDQAVWTTRTADDNLELSDD
jgi:hypothetical protein